MAQSNKRRIGRDNFNPENPRRITPEKLAELSKSLKRFGDLGGIVLNRRSKRMIGAHQRVAAFEKGTVEAVITERLKKPDRTGTVAYGYVEMFGTKFTYREVDWDQTTERAAMLAANKQGGEWDEDALRTVLSALKESGAEINESGFDQDEFEALMARAPVPPTPPDEFPAVGANIATQYECPKCKYRWSGKPHST